jgi:hypothetical protein
VANAPAYVCSQGAKALETVTCQTIIQLQTPEDFQLVLQVSKIDCFSQVMGYV